MLANRNPCRPAGSRFWTVPVALLLLAPALRSIGPVQATAHTPISKQPLGNATAYVANYASDTVTPIDTGTNTPEPAIPVGCHPDAIAITPDGRTLYVVNSDSDSVTPIDTATNRPGPSIPVGNYPGAIAITPDGKTAYVVNENSNTVTPINTATNNAGTPIPMPGSAADRPTNIAITPDGKTAYVTNGTADTVTPIAIATNIAETPIILPGGTGVDYIAITPDSKTAYAPSEWTTRVTPIAAATSTAEPPITVGFNPTQIVISPDGATAWVTDAGNDESAGTVTAISTATNTSSSPIPVGLDAGHLAVTRDSKTVYVVNTDPGGPGTVTPISAATHTAGPPIAVGRNPFEIVIAPPLGRAPVITSPSAYTATFLKAFSFTTTATGIPAPTISENGRLPRGVVFKADSDGTATISGRPRGCPNRVYHLTLTATNSNGTTAQAFTLTVKTPKRP
jgi:YVTN family beta-propeller protein